MIRNIARPILLPMPTPNVSASPSATADITTTRAIPDGMMNVSRKSVMMRPSRMRE